MVLLVHPLMVVAVAAVMRSPQLEVAAVTMHHLRVQVVVVVVVVSGRSLKKIEVVEVVLVAQ